MVLLAGFVVVVGRWCGQDDVVVGAPIAGRDRAELEGLIGFFVNTLVLRVDVSGDPSFGELVGRVREVALGAYGHAEVPFEKLVEELAPERDLSRNPLFQVTFQLFESPSAPGAVGVGAGLEIPVTSSLFDLRVDVSPSVEGGLAGRVEFDTDLFDRVSMEWLVERFVWVLEQVAVDPGCRVGSLSLVPAAQGGLVAGWNDTGVGVRGEGVHRRVEAWVGVDPGRVAVGDAGGVWSFGELNGFANRLAWGLLELGVERGDVVAVWLPRGREFVAAVLGVVKAGGMYLPLDGAYPPGRVAQVVGDAAPVVLVTLAGWVEGVEVPAGTRVLVVDEWPAGPVEDPGVAVGGRDAAYVIYTSGSTGTPKGVVVEHGSLANLVGWHNRVYGVDGAARGSQIASVGFDAAVWEIWPYLCAGASVWVADDDTRADADRLVGWLADQGITTAFVPTPLAEMVLERSWPAHAVLRYLLTGGDTLRRWANPAHPYTLVNHYGPTEHTVVTTATPVPATPHPDRLPAIGAPIDNTVCYVVDHVGQLAGPGVPGELWVGGLGCARGYHHDDALSAERFVPNPFEAAPPRLYRTGDHVRWNADGTLSFLGRLDHQIKIRGYRIEPRELETLLTRHPHITNAIITTHPHPTTHTPQLTAYITTTTDGVIAPGEIRTWLHGRLPAPMVPAAVVPIDAVPLTTNGKVDHTRLPAPSFGADEAPVRASGPAEELLCRLWAETLRVEEVGVTDDFFERGGHSLVATQLVSRIRDALQVELPLRVLFERPTVAAVADALREDPAVAARLDRTAEVVLQVMDLSDEDVAGLVGEAGSPDGSAPDRGDRA